MAQFDVRRNPSRRTARDLPYVVEVQSASLVSLTRGDIMPA